MVISSLSLWLLFRGDFGNDMGNLLRRKRCQKPQFLHTLLFDFIIFTHFVENNKVGDTKAPLLRCFLVISKLKSGDTITTEKYMNYQTFSYLQFRRLLKNSFDSIQNDLRDSSDEKIPFVSVGITRLFLLFRKVSDVHFWLNVNEKWTFFITDDSTNNEDEYLVPSFKFLGHLRFLSPEKILFRPLDASEQTCWGSQYLKLRLMSAVRNISNQLLKTWSDKFWENS